MRTPVTYAFTCAIVAALIAVPARAQDSHYWTVQYGPRAALLGGAVIGSVNDVSAAYYNPGGLAIADSLGFALSISVFEHSSTNAESARNGDERSTSRTGVGPSMLGGAIKGPDDGRHVFAYSLITRQRLRNNISGVTTTAPAGYETLVGQVSLNRDASERWIGLSWAHAIRPHLGIGATAFVSMRFDSRILHVDVTGIRGGEGITASSVREFDYEHYAVIPKFGALLDYPSFAAGLTVTAPSSTVYSAGDVRYSDIRALDPSGGAPPVIAVTNPDGLDAKHKRPFSVGLGLRAGPPSLRFYGSAEWFAPVDEYDVIRSGTFEAQSPGGQLEYVVVDRRESTLNWAIAADHRVSDAITTYLSFATDISSSDGSSQALLVVPWDIHTVSLGVDLRVRGRSLTVGGAFGWGGSPTRNLDDLVPPGRFEPPPGFEPALISYRSFRLILGFEL